MLPENSSNIRDKRLTTEIMELITVHQGIHYNEIIKKLTDEGFSSHTVIGKKLKQLQQMQLIEYQTLSNKHRYFIYGNTKRV